MRGWVGWINLKKVLTGRDPENSGPAQVPDLNCPTRRAVKSRGETKRTYYTLKRVEISKPGGIWTAREGRQGKTQANAKLSQGNEQKKGRGERKKRGEIEEKEPREEAREKGWGGHRLRRPLAQAGACDSARKWGGDGAAQPQRNAAKLL